MIRPTGRACPLPHREQHFVPALGADLATRMPTVHDHHHHFAALRGLVFELPPEFAKAHIRNHAGQLVFFQHPRPIQILNGDDVKSPPDQW